MRAHGVADKPKSAGDQFLAPSAKCRRGDTALFRETVFVNSAEIRALPTGPSISNDSSACLSWLLYKALDQRFVVRYWVFCGMTGNILGRLRKNEGLI